MSTGSHGSLMPAFVEPVSLRIIICSDSLTNSKMLAHIMVDLIHKFGTLVVDEDRRSSLLALQPESFFRDGDGGLIFDWDSIHPLGKVARGRKDVLVAIGCRLERPHQVDSYLAPKFGRHRYQMECSGDFVERIVPVPQMSSFEYRNGRLRRSPCDTSTA